MGDQLFDRGEALVAFPFKETECVRQPPQNAHAFDFGKKNQPASRALGIELGTRREATDWAVHEMADLHQLAIFLPLAKAFLPP